jgi:thiamine-phosphate pyrophosphorylase
MDNRLSLDAIRVIDANANRAAEGLRTLEDIARFILNDQVICSSLKGIRHELELCVAAICGNDRYRVRDVVGDVGTSVSTSTEVQRSHVNSIAEAATARTQQAIRVIEEFSKLADEVTAVAVERLRYQLYSANQSLLSRLNRDTDFLQQAKLYALVDCKLELPQFADRIAAISEAGVDLIQIRDKAADAAVLLSYLHAAIAQIDFAKTRIIMNDRVDVTAAAWNKVRSDQASTAGQVAGVHLGQTDIPVTFARRQLATTQWIGLSTHDSEQLHEALKLDIDYVGCGPTFPSQTKKFDGFAGLDYLRHVAEQCELPAFAIGGINSTNVSQVLHTGIHRIAVSDAIWNSPQPAQAAQVLRDRLS